MATFIDFLDSIGYLYMVLFTCFSLLVFSKLLNKSSKKRYLYITIICSIILTFILFVSLIQQDYYSLGGLILILGYFTFHFCFRDISLKTNHDKMRIIAFIFAFLGLFVTLMLYVLLEINYLILSVLIIAVFEGFIRIMYSQNKN